MIYAHSAVDWGNVPAWVGSVLTSGSLALGFVILLRDRRAKTEGQARKLATSYHWYSDGNPETSVLGIAVLLHNSSNEIIFEPRIQALPKRRYRESIGAVTQGLLVTRPTPLADPENIVSAVNLFPGETATIRVDTQCAYTDYNYVVMFRDAQGEMWQRSLTSPIGHALYRYPIPLPALLLSLKARRFQREHRYKGMASAAR